MKTKVSGWFARLLSQGGKEVLIKTVAMSMSVYAMSVFKLPKSTCDSLASALSDFWWNSLEHKQKIHWVSWEKLCLSKENGGMGFKDVENFNQALLAKQAWRVLHYPDCLLASVLKSRYFPFVDLLQAQLGTRPSYAWRSLLFGRELLKEGLQQLVGNGKNIRVWLDPWVKDDSMRVPWIKNMTFNVNLMVSELIDYENRDWRLDKLKEIFVPGDIKLIQKRKPLVSTADFWEWKYNSNGLYTVKSGYWLASRLKMSSALQLAETLPSLNSLKAAVWKIQTQPKIQCFMWKALSGAIPVSSKLASRGIKVDSRCQVWAVSDFPSPAGGFDSHSVFENFSYLLQSQNREDIPVEIKRSFPWTLWFIWKNRNQLIFHGQLFDPVTTVRKIREASERWFMAQVIGSEQQASYQVQPSHEDLRWEPPPVSWVKCNIGHSWNRKSGILGGAWVLRDAQGLVILNSRRSFRHSGSSMEAKFLCTAWAVESMRSHHVDNVIFCSQDSDLLGAVLRPRAWPSFRYYASELLLLLEGVINWKLQVVPPEANRGATFIAQSVLDCDFHQSYVAAHQPRWLSALFDDECLSSVVV